MSISNSNYINTSLIQKFTDLLHSRSSDRCWDTKGDLYLSSKSSGSTGEKRQLLITLCNLRDRSTKMQRKHPKRLCRWWMTKPDHARCRGQHDQGQTWTRTALSVADMCRQDLDWECAVWSSGGPWTFSWPGVTWKDFKAKLWGR